MTKSIDLKIEADLSLQLSLYYAMKIIPILLRGSLKEDLSYNFGAIYPITQGEWEVSIQTVSFEYNKSRNKKIPDPPRINEFLYISCNYVENVNILANEERTVERSTLSVLLVDIAAGQKKHFPFTVRDYFHISSPSRKFILQVRDEHNEQLPDAVQNKLNITVALLFRRKS